VNDLISLLLVFPYFCCYAY